MPQYWLMKSEPDAFSIHDLKQQGPSPWDGVRNYQARNFMKNMEVGDLVFFYHSSCKPAGIAGIAQVTRRAYPDYTSWDSSSPYYDPKSTKESPRWFMVDIELVKILPSIITLSRLKQDPALSDMTLVKKGSRLSVMPVLASEWQHILNTTHQA
ncbi:EVE domain-containing protein [Marinomonas pollencensis]|uniref:Putative RNA-binding protein with PUA-like domain n=1 Tax=Marinomonas pollencensis TaxID=491954 RepID=A0A3E0DN15_9GAMM|nr:EVE domain-containing protein [Marinomonas pollencensis]REG84244.1 putative RNA-binding protein with PUA-like domain [Marinomonas pollencensis]